MAPRSKIFYRANLFAQVCIFVMMNTVTSTQIWHNPNKIRVDISSGGQALLHPGLKRQHNCQKSGAAYEFLRGSFSIARLLQQKEKLLPSTISPPVGFDENRNAAHILKDGETVHEYIPSVWESDWRLHASEYSTKICETMKKDTDRVEHWMTMAERYNKTGPTQTTLATFNSTTFPRFVYRNMCPSNMLPRTLEVPMEPLVGHLRNPYWGACQFPNKPKEEVPVEDREYLIINAVPSATFQAMHQGRKYLFDLGTSYYNTSLSWVADRYRALGVDFDEIWAWEVSQQLAQDPYQNYWKYVPEDMQPKLHFYNFAISSNHESPSYPMNIIRNIYRPGDFIVVKMDVEGNIPVEEGMLKPFLQEAGAAKYVSEFFYELHFGKDIFNLEDQVSMEDAMQSFHKLRSRGLRIHYWP